VLAALEARAALVAAVALAAAGPVLVALAAVPAES
jgi:hypothetical protein